MPPLTNLRTPSVLLAGLLSLFSASASANIDLIYSPSVQAVRPDTIVEVDLIAQSDDATSQGFALLDAILLWDPTSLELVGVHYDNAGYPWFNPGFLNDGDGLNNGILVEPMGIPFNDGDAVFSAWALPGGEASAPPGGLTVTTIQFRALTETDATVVSFLPSFILVETRLLNLSLANVTGDISSTATVQIVGCSSDVGDTDGNGLIEMDDIDAAVQVLLAPEDATPAQREAVDSDCNGEVDGRDIQPLVELWLLLL